MVLGSGPNPGLYLVIELVMVLGSGPNPGLYLVIALVMVLVQFCHPLTLFFIDINMNA